MASAKQVQLDQFSTSLVENDSVALLASEKWQIAFSFHGNFAEGIKCQLPLFNTHNAPKMAQTEPELEQF